MKKVIIAFVFASALMAAFSASAQNYVYTEASKLTIIGKLMPGKPMIFQQTIYRERRNFNTGEDEKEQAKIDMAEAIFKEIKSTPEGRNKYKDVYFIHPEACPPSHEASVDGVHPDNYGYTLWMQSIRKPIVKILRKYGIR